MKQYYNYFILLTFASFLSCSQLPKAEEITNKTDPIINFEKRLDSLGIELQPVSPPVANYVNIVQTGKLLFLAGKGPRNKDGSTISGKVGRDLSIEEGYEAAKNVAGQQLAVLKDYLGDLNKVKRIVKVLGMVNCTEDFGNQPQVINGFSDTMVDIFGEKGKHARAAVGMNSLPSNICVEIEMIVEVY
jgi:enamine deaminase RidA (YjgF/YER057c/UK114 family)